MRYSEWAELGIYAECTVVAIVDDTLDGDYLHELVFLIYCNYHLLDPSAKCQCLGKLNKTLLKLLGDDLAR